jgi:hypothetical protein
MPGIGQTAYPTAEAVMNRARALVNDAYQGGAGRILTDSAPFSVEFLNSAIEELEDDLGNNGVITLIVDDFILTPITPVVTPDPSVQVSISYTGYFDGTTNHALPALPGDCISVKQLWERVTGSSENFIPMHEPQGPLYPRAQDIWLRQWEYRQDAIFMIGSLQTEDIRMRYETRFTPIGKGVNLSTVQVNILASTNALATIVAYVYARARGAAQAQLMQADAELQKKRIINRYVRRAQGKPCHRRAYGGDDGWQSFQI